LKNFILVINKEKIYAYAVSICTIVTLFFMSNFINSNFDDAEVVSSNITENIISTEEFMNNIVSNESNDFNNKIN